MPRKKKTIIEESLPDNVLTTEEGENIMFDDNSPIDEVFDSFGEEPFLMKVYRITPTGSSFVFSSTEKPNPATFESSIQDRCPTGGKFVIRFYKNNRIIEPSRHIEIEPRPIPTVPNSVNETIQSAQIRIMQDNINMFQQMIMAFIGRPTPVTQQTPISELVAAMTAMHGIQPTKADPVELLIKGMELGSKSGAASPDWKSELIHTAKDVLAPVAEVVAQYKLQQNTPTPQIERTTNDTMRLPTSNSTLVKIGLATLKPKILSGSLEPGLAVDWVLANANDATYQPFLVMALQGDINTFIQIDSDFAKEPYKTWIETTIGMLKEAYGHNNQANNDGRTGNDTDTTTNETVSVGVSELPKVS